MNQSRILRSFQPGEEEASQPKVVAQQERQVRDPRKNDLIAHPSPVCVDAPAHPLPPLYVHSLAERSRVNPVKDHREIKSMNTISLGGGKQPEGPVLHPEKVVLPQAEAFKKLPSEKNPRSGKRIKGCQHLKLFGELRSKKIPLFRRPFAPLGGGKSTERNDLAKENPHLPAGNHLPHRSVQTAK
jgi:hypothetical protein